MATIVELPRLSDTMEEGVIAKWHITVGDKVKRGQIIADIETDKATMEFESFDAGIVLDLVAPEGEALPIGAPIAVFGKQGEDAKAALAAHGGNGAAAPEPTPVAVAPAAAPVPASTPPAAALSQPQPAPAAANELPRDDGRVPASPLARRLAREYGLRLADIPGSGPNGRVVKEDVERVRGSATPVQTTSGGFVSRPDTTIKLSQMRKTIARRMAAAKSEIPHFYLTIKVDMGPAVALRNQLKTALPDTKISFNDMVVMAVAKALVVHPEVNAYWDGQTIVRRGDIHVGVAVAVDEGLIVPPVRFADQKSLRQIATESRELGSQARERTLDPTQMTGSTFTVSNLGMFGIEEFSAVINPGEGAILAVGAISDEVVTHDGGFAAAKRMKVTMACDHRVMDGAMGAKFLQTFRDRLEQPLSMLA